MIVLPLLLALGITDPPVRNGRAGEIAVRPPRSSETITIDGVLSEPVWKQAAILNGFSQFSPQDGIPAADSTQILVWYSATAIHFGVRAYEPHGAEEPLGLQNHDTPARYRNIWVRRLRGYDQP